MQISRTRRGLAALTALGVALGLSAALVPPAQADTDSTLTIVGTSDVSDSHLFLDVLKPGFEAAYPQYTVTYSGSATQKAIDNAKSGLGSALIVHAASLENQFVGDGYSVEQYGRAIFWGDFVLLGPASDPAHVMTGTSPATDPEDAFQKIATAGAAGDAFLVARETGSGTDVQSHVIWSKTTGVHTCDVATANGGGTRPADASITGACPTNAPDIPASYPAWYRASGQTQAPNIQTADVCGTLPGPGSVSGNHNCYVFTDRGTFQFLHDTSAISNLQIVLRGSSLDLVNSFHAYAINPDKFTGTPSVHINKAAALAFLNWITSPSAQAAVGNYLNGTKDAPFLPSAAPRLTVSRAPATVTAGSAFSLSGTLANVVPGTPHLNGVQVKLVGTPAVGPGITATTVATTTTDANGRFSFRYSPQASLIYRVDVGGISKVENGSLNPPFGDLLQPASASAGRTVVIGTTRIGKAKLKRHRIAEVKGTFAPRAAAGATFQVWGKKGNHAAKLLKAVGLATGASSYDAKVKLKKGTWRLRVVYVNGTSSQSAASTFSKKIKVT